jgi:hypothetical protein
MSDDVAKYGISIDSSAAEQGRDKTVRAFRDIGNAAGATADAELRRQAVFAQDQSVQYMRGLAQASTTAGRQMGLLELQAYKLDAALAGRGADSVAHVGGHDIGLIRRELVSLTSQMTGTIPLVDRLGGSLLSMGAGSEVALGVVAGIAAISAAYHFLTSEAREAAEAQDKAVKSLLEWEKVKQQGAAGSFGLEVTRARENLAKAQKELAAHQTMMRGNASPLVDAADAGLGGFGLTAKQEDKRVKDLVQAVKDGGEKVLEVVQQANAKYLTERLHFNQKDVKARSEAIALVKHDREEYEKALALPYNEKNSSDVARYAEEIQQLQDALYPKEPSDAKAQRLALQEARYDHLIRLRNLQIEISNEIDKTLKKQAVFTQQMKDALPGVKAEVDRIRNRYNNAGGDFDAIAAKRYSDEMRDVWISGFEQIATHGTKSFQNFFEEVLSMSRRAMAVMEKEGKNNGFLYGALGVGSSAITGGLAGYQIGRQTGSYAAGALGGAASGAMAGFQIAGPVGAAAGALAGLAGGIFGAGRAAAEAAKQMHELQTAVTLSMASLRAEVDHNTLGGGIAQINADREARRKAIEDAYSGGSASSEQVAKRVAALNEMNKLEDKRIKQLIEETAAAVALVEQQKKRDEEDLSVRMLAAQGYTDASSDAAFRNQQQRDYQDAVTAKRSPEYLALLTATQMQEAIQRATERDIANQTAVIQNANKAQQEALDAQLKTANDALKIGQDQLRTAEENARALQQVVDSLGKFSDSLKLSELSPLSPIDQLAEAKRQLDADYAKAQGGDLQAGSDFANYAKAFLTASREVNASGTAYASDFATVQQMTDALQGKFGPQLTADQQIVAQLTAANAALQAQIDAIQAAKDAAQASADAQTAALIAKSDAQTASILAGLEKNRNAALLPADSLLTALAVIANNVTGAAQATITAEQAALFESRNAAEAAANAQIEAIRQGRDAATIHSLALINEMQAARLAANTNAISVEAEIIKNGVLGKSAVDTLVANRQAADAAALASIAAIKNGSDAATRDNLQQIAALEQSRLESNAAAYRQEDALAVQRAVLERQIAERQAAETYQQQQDDVQYQQMLAQKAALDDQITAIDAVRKAADDKAKEQIAVLAAIRDKNWTPTIVFTPPPTDTYTGNPSGGTGTGTGIGPDGKPIPMFASGGDFAGGMRVVGERGPELEFTGPSRIVSASQSSSLLADALGQSAEMAAELRDLNDSSAATVAVLQAGLLALVHRVEELTARVEENTKATKRGFEGMS